MLEVLILRPLSLTHQWRDKSFGTHQTDHSVRCVRNQGLPPVIQRPNTSSGTPGPDNQTLGSGSYHQWAGSSPRTSFYPLVGGHQLQDHQDPNFAHQ